jgi:hypothetical protein
MSRSKFEPGNSLVNRLSMSTIFKTPSSLYPWNRFPFYKLLLIRKSTNSSHCNDLMIKYRTQNRSLFVPVSKPPQSNPRTPNQFFNVTLNGLLPSLQRLYLPIFVACFPMEAFSVVYCCLCCVFSVLYYSVTLYYSVLLFFFCVL